MLDRAKVAIGRTWPEPAGESAFDVTAGGTEALDGGHRAQRVMKFFVTWMATHTATRARDEICHAMSRT
jgi:hypothetical protein